MNKDLLEKFFKSYELMSRANNIKLIGVSGRILFDFSPSEDGFWLAEFTNGLLQPIREEKTENYDVKLTTRLEDLILAHQKCVMIQDAIAQGWIKVEGDTSLIQKLNQAGVR